jgi:hypothetical protein
MNVRGPLNRGVRAESAGRWCIRGQDASPAADEGGVALSLRTRLRARRPAAGHEPVAAALAAALATGAPRAVTAAAEALGRHAGADGCTLVRFEAADAGRVLGAWTVGTPRYRTGLLLDLEPGGELRRVLEEGVSVRVDRYPAGSDSRVARLGYGCFVGVPLGWGWGAVALTAVAPGALPADAAARVEACVALASLPGCPRPPRSSR